MEIYMANFSIYVVTKFSLKDHKIYPFVWFVFVVSVAQILHLHCFTHFPPTHIMLPTQGLSVHMFTFLGQMFRHPASLPMWFPQKNTFKYIIPGQNAYSISRSQSPLLPAYAYMVNKIQGQSLQCTLLDLKSAHGTQALYVMISHAV